ncbi:MAG: hypothetical protein IJT57_00590 [Selenomonadaceae bacterium]|nr:hypothetical protein [Selenomonadaceae bacterium]MBQ7722797.1 hypothetical protein [Selenomonadaceae bacterium]
MSENRTVKQRVDTIETKFEMFMKSQDERFNAFMHELQQQREDIRQINTRIDSMNMRIDSKFDALTNQIHNLTIAAVVGFGAIALAVGGLVVSILK